MPKTDDPEFDSFAYDYRALHEHNIRLSGETPDFFAEYKVRDVADVLGYSADGAGGGGDAGPTILDFGGGTGVSIKYFRKHFPRAALTCLDVSRNSLALAAERFGDEARFVQFDGSAVPFDDGCFDVAFAAGVFHHIDHRHHDAVLNEIHRVLKPSGALFVFEHNPLNPLTLHAVNTCEFDQNAHLIHGRTMKRRLRAAGFVELQLRYRIFFPGPLVALRPLERFLTGIPFGAQYYVHGKKR